MSARIWRGAALWTALAALSIATFSCAAATDGSKEDPADPLVDGGDPYADARPPLPTPPTPPSGDGGVTDDAGAPPPPPPSDCAYPAAPYGKEVGQVLPNWDGVGYERYQSTGLASTGTYGAIDMAKVRCAQKSKVKYAILHMSAFW